MGWAVGWTVGRAVGLAVVGLVVGLAVGLAVVGLAVVGLVVGDPVGGAVGAFVAAAGVGSSFITTTVLSAMTIIVVGAEPEPEYDFPLFQAFPAGVLSVRRRGAFGGMTPRSLSGPSGRDEDEAVIYVGPLREPTRTRERNVASLITRSGKG